MRLATREMDKVLICRALSRHGRGRGYAGCEGGGGWKVREGGPKGIEVFLLEIRGASKSKGKQTAGWAPDAEDVQADTDLVNIFSPHADLCGVYSNTFLRKQGIRVLRSRGELQDFVEGKEREGQAVKGKRVTVKAQFEWVWGDGISDSDGGSDSDLDDVLQRQVPPAPLPSLSLSRHDSAHVPFVLAEICPTCFRSSIDSQVERLGEAMKSGKRGKGRGGRARSEK